MKITFNNCDYKYEIEAILKTFFPSEQFEFNFTGDKTKYDKSYEHAACKNLYTKLVDLTGHSQPWGILTGIRPVKKLNDLIFSGKSYDEASNFLKNEFFLSDEKFNLIKNIAENQAKFLKSESNKFSLYVGIPYCPSRCAYCSFVSHSVESQSAKRTVKPYIENLCKEIKKTAEVAYDLGLKPETIYVGGGTPTALKSEEIDIILSEIAKNFNILAVNEYTVEAGRPDTFSAEKLQILKKHGVRRISVNPQTTNDT
ncbi:MAG: radical SAM protein, partial [Ruminococcus sp.]|nr:radical SAM protein [Ruminococcus sp.]